MNLKNVSLILTGLLAFILGADSSRPADCVNLLIGTATFSDQSFMGNNPAQESYYGCVVPGPRTPGGLVNLSPVTSFRGRYHTRGSGYRHEDSTIMGFTHLNHEYNQYANILFMPVTGTPKIIPGTIEERNSGYRLRKDFGTEVARAGTYSVRLADGKISVDLTVTDNCGFHRYAFAPLSQPAVLVDLSISQNFTPVRDAQITIQPDRYISGWQECVDTEYEKGRRFRIFFFAEFDKPFSGFTTWKDGRLFEGTGSQNGSSVGAYVAFADANSAKVLVKVGISLESIEDAKAKLKREIPGWDFDGVARETTERWNDALSRIQVETTNRDKEVIFYTSLYRCLKPESAAKHLGAAVIQALIYPQWIEQWLNKDNWPISKGGFWGSGYEPWLLGLYNRGIKNMPLEKAYQAIRQGATDPATGWVRLADYIKFGYIPFNPSAKDYWDPNDYGDVVSRTIGYSYTDHCIAKLAQILHKDDDYGYFTRRSKNYLNLFDPNCGFFRAKTADGRWVEPFDPAKPDVMRIYREGNAWQYLWFPRHDVDGLIQLLGGKDAFLKKLDRFFATPYVTDTPVLDITGMIGQYCHGNEIDRWAPYYYALAGAPEKTQQTVRLIMDTLHKAEPDGLCGMDDHGTLSSWYVFSALGFFPVDAASPDYVLASPIFDRADIHLPNGKIFTILTKDNSSANIYVQRATLNGRKLDRPVLTHDQIIAGGTLELKMTGTQLTIEK